MTTISITNPETHNTIQFLINNLPKPDPASGTGCHIMLITRADPPIPLSRWRLNGELNEIRTDDLRFSLEEAAILLNQHLQLGLYVEDVNELNSRTEGWVAGLHLTAASLHGKKPKTFHNFIQELKGSYRYFSDYLLEEVYLQQTEEIQNFLLNTCILDRMNGDLCDEILSSKDSYRTLELLERNNIFLVPLDQERHWYRYHHFFADALRNRLENMQKETIQKLHSKAASGFGEHNYIEESIKHLDCSKRI